MTKSSMNLSLIKRMVLTNLRYIFLLIIKRVKRNATIYLQLEISIVLFLSF